MGANRTKQKKAAAAAAAVNFDQNALAQLTARLDTTLASQAEGALQTKRKRLQDADDSDGAKKRQDRLGPTKQRQEQDGDTADNILLKEILALGGDEDDYNLVANVDSGNEDDKAPESKAPDLKLPSAIAFDESLQRELAKFATTLGFQHLPDDDDVDTDASEDVDETPFKKPTEKPAEKSIESAKKKQQVREAEGSTASAPAPSETRQSKLSGKLVSGLSPWDR